MQDIIVDLGIGSWELKYILNEELENSGQKDNPTHFSRKHDKVVKVLSKLLNSQFSDNLRNCWSTWMIYF